MAPQAPWSSTSHAFAQHQFSQVANFWRQGHQASFRLEALPGGRAELNLTFHLPPASEVIPPPIPVLPVPAQRLIHPLFPKGSFSHAKPAPGNSLPSQSPKGAPASSSPNRPRSAAQQRRSHHRTCLHKAKLAALQLPPPSFGSLRALAMAAQTASVLQPPPSHPESAVSAAPSPPAAALLASSPLPGPTSLPSPIPQLDGALFSPSYSETDANVTRPLVINCLNCKGPMSPSHQCEETLVVKPTPPRRIRPMKFCDNCDTLYQSGTKCLACVIPAPPP